MIVLDASVLNKLFLPYEEGRELVQELLIKHLEERESIIVPDLLFYEVANTLATKRGIPSENIASSLKRLYEAKIEIYHPTITDMIQAANQAKEYQTSVYDMTYVVLAERNQCRLITADEKFARKVNLPFVTLLADLQT